MHPRTCGQHHVLGLTCLPDGSVLRTGVPAYLRGGCDLWSLSSSSSSELIGCRPVSDKPVHLCCITHLLLPNSPFLFTTHTSVLNDRLNTAYDALLYACFCRTSGGDSGSCARSPDHCVSFTASTINRINR